jgi:pSer/pThr/pTyr-binding forkhead associated (FHA) protein
MIKIIVSLKDKILHEIILHEDSITTIGRDQSNNIHLVNPAVSRFHARVCSQGPDFYVEDLGSANGTYLNGKMIPLTAELSNSDKIGIGKYTLLFIDQKTESEEVKIEREDETIVVQRAQQPKNAGAKEKAGTTKGHGKEKREIADKDKKIFIALLVIIGIAVVLVILANAL